MASAPPCSISCCAELRSALWLVRSPPLPTRDSLELGLRLHWGGGPFSGMVKALGVVLSDLCGCLYVMFVSLHVHVLTQHHAHLAHVPCPLSQSPGSTQPAPLSLTLHNDLRAVGGHRLSRKCGATHVRNTPDMACFHPVHQHSLSTHLHSFNGRTMNFRLHVSPPSTQPLPLRD